MRFRAGHLACLLLLLSSLAVSSARAAEVAPARTPGGVFVRNLLLRAAVEETEAAACGYEREEFAVVANVAAPLPSRSYAVPRPLTHTAHVHAVTGSSL